MTFLSSFFMLAVLAVFSSVHAYQPLSISSLKDFSSSSSYSVESAGGSVSATSVTPIYGSAAHHIPLSVNNKLEGRIKRTQRAHNGMMIETVDAVIAGCPSRDFSAQVNIGSQAFSLIVDTGSTTLGVAGSTCSCGPANPTYTPGTTASMVTSSTTAFVSSYGDKSTWSAAGYNDQVSVGNSKSAGTIFGSITQQTGFFQSSTCSGASGSQSQGIMGFAGPKLAAAANDNSGVNAQQWFAQYQAAAQVPDIFAIQMCLLTGDLWLGGYDNTTFSGELHWINIQPLTLVLSAGGTVTLNPGQAYYTVAVNSIGLTGFTADTNSGDYQGVNVNTIVDSGTTLMLIPTAAYNDILNALTNNYASQFNSIFGVSPSTFFTSGVCYQSGTSAENMNSMLPTMEVVLGGAQNNAPLYITLRAVSSYIEQSVSGGSTFYCPGIRASTSSTNILGWTFINQLIVAHDLRNLKLGFGLRTGCKDTSVGAFNVTGGETGVADAAIEGGSVTNTGAAGGGSDPGGNSSGIFNSLSGLSTTNIIIIVVAVVAGLIILLALCWCCQSRQKSMGEQTVQLSLERQQEQEFGKF